MPFIQYQGRSRPVGPGVLTIGGGREAAWRIEGKGLLARHALITLERDGRVTVVGATPDAPVYVNGERLASARPLAADDVFVLGEASFTLVEEAPAAPEGEDGHFIDLRRSRVYPVGDGGKIGREPGSMVLLQEPDVAKVQAEVRRSGANYTLVPLAPHTLLNGVKVGDPTPLREGDEVTIGLTTLRFTRRAPERDLLDPGARHTPDQRRRTAERFTTAGAPTRGASRALARRRLSRMWLWVALAVLAVLIGAGVAAWQRGVLFAAPAWGVRVDIQPHGPAR
jgi:FHA domain